ncbi:MAG: hypothetical protein J5654_06055 [Victivallales bacterium]|nr:hypothetical protein [Victivallales bacterium]
MQSLNGTHGTTGTHGTHGAHGTHGTHGTSGMHGTSGTHGTHGTHGTSGTHGTPSGSSCLAIGPGCPNRPRGPIYSFWQVKDNIIPPCFCIRAHARPDREACPHPLQQ